jgi:hypothetical protein
MRVRSVVVSLAAVLLTVPMALVAPGTAFASRQLVDPNTLHPVPHDGGQPVCEWQGNFIQCHTTIPQVIDLGTFDPYMACGDVELAQTATWTFERGIAIYNADGYVVKLIYVDSYTGSFSNPTTGKSVAWTQQDRATYEFTTPGDDSTGTFTMTEHQRVYGSTGRVILSDDGTEVFSLPDYTRLKAAGHHPIDDAWAAGITTGLAPMCDALA